MLPVPHESQLPAVIPDRTLEERVDASLRFLERHLGAHGFGPLVAGLDMPEGCLMLKNDQVMLDCALVDGYSVVGIQDGQSHRLSQATGTAMALRILVTESRGSGAGHMSHVPLSSEMAVERDVVYNVLRTVSDWITRSTGPKSIGGTGGIRQLQ